MAGGIGGGAMIGDADDFLAEFHEMCERYGLVDTLIVSRGNGDGSGVVAWRVGDDPSLVRHRERGILLLFEVEAMARRKQRDFGAAVGWGG